VKTPEQVLTQVRHRLRDSWHLDATRPPLSGAATAPKPTWPHRFFLGEPRQDELQARFAHYQQMVRTWRSWADEHAVTLTDTPRDVHGTTQRLPTHVTVPDIDTAARLAGPDQVAQLHRSRTRAAQLRDQFPTVADIAPFVRAVDTYTNVDFELLCTTATWFATHSAVGLTPRQVPVPGLHAKWLNTGQHLVAALAGLPDLGLAPRHPPRLHFTYLDPDHRARGARQHDSVTVGDPMTPAYRPTIAIISENKDTALHFLPLSSGISVEGAGCGGGTAAAIDWLRTCPRLFYWGDMDAAGFTILNGFRAVGLPVTSVLMNLPTYEEYEAYGTSTDARGRPIPPGNRRPLPHLTSDERQLYDLITDPTWTRYRRVEQEKIPLTVALDAVHALLRSPHAPPDN
jgi:hypothetical protein